MDNSFNAHNRPNQPRVNQGNRNNHPRYGKESTAAQKLPDDYVDQAEKIMKALMQGYNRLTTTKLRNILSRVSDIYNVEINRTEEELLPESYSSLQMTRVRIAYECGREQSVQEFVKRTNLMHYIKDVKKSRVEFIRFARYMEALVAYHRYFGGKDQ